MANDRLWLRCKLCNAKILLYKFYPSLSYVFHEVDRYAKFLEDHTLFCGVPQHKVEADGYVEGSIFDIRSENYEEIPDEDKEL